MYYQRSAYRFLCITSGLPTATQRSAHRSSCQPSLFTERAVRTVRIVLHLL